MGFLLWPFCLLNMQALSFLFDFGWEAEASYSQLHYVCRGLTQAITSGSPGLSFP